MGRFYTDGDDLTEEEREAWKHELDQMIREPNGQAFLHYIKRGMEALPERKLIADGLYHRIEIELDDGDSVTIKEEACALGAALRFKILEGGAVIVAKGDNGTVERRTLDELNTDAGWLDEDGYEHAVWAEHTFGVPEELTWHIGWLNDEKWEGLTETGRFQRMMAWIDERLVTEVAA